MKKAVLVLPNHSINWHAHLQEQMFDISTISRSGWITIANTEHNLRLFRGLPNMERFRRFLRGGHIRVWDQRVKIIDPLQLNNEEASLLLRKEE